MNESTILDDDESSFTPCLKNDQVRRIAWFFSKVETRIDKLSSSYKCEKDDAGLLYFEKLCQMGQRKSEPTPIYLNKLRQIIQMESNTSHIQKHNALRRC